MTKDVIRHVTVGAHNIPVGGLEWWLVRQRAFEVEDRTSPPLNLDGVSSPPGLDRILPPLLHGTILSIPRRSVGTRITPGRIMAFLMPIRGAGCHVDVSIISAEEGKQWQTRLEHWCGPASAVGRVSGQRNVQQRRRGRAWRSDFGRCGITDSASARSASRRRCRRRREKAVQSSRGRGGGRDGASREAAEVEAVKSLAPAALGRRLCSVLFMM